jgi:hypothetical protein
VSQAAETLRISKDAVRMRVKSGTLRSEKEEDERVYLWGTLFPTPTLTAFTF